MGALNMIHKKWNKLDKSKRSSYSSGVFKHDFSLETYLELWWEKKQYLGICVFQKIQMFRCYFSKVPGVIFKESCLKATGLYNDLLLLPSLFHFFYFIFSALISVCFPFFHLFFFIVGLSQGSIKCNWKAFVVCVCVCVYIHIICIIEYIYILENLWIFA